MAMTADDILAQEMAQEWERLLKTPAADAVHPSIADGLALVVKMEEHCTPLHLLAPAVAVLKDDPQASAGAVYAAMAAAPVSHLTLRKARAILETGMPPPSATSAHPLDAIREARGEKAAFPLNDPGAADRAAAKAAAAERDAEKARSEALLARLDEMEARHARETADLRASNAAMEALFDAATEPAESAPGE